MNTTPQFKTTLTLYMPVGIQEEEVDDWRRDKTSRSAPSSVIPKGGLLLPSDHEEEKITIMTTSVVPSGKGLPTDSPEAASAVEKEAVATQLTTPHKGTIQEEVEAVSS